MTRDELEFSISQYHDGTLLPLERSTVEEVLARDADACAILSNYQRLDSMLASDSSLALPAMDWEAVHARMSAAIARAQDPVKTFRLPNWALWGSSVAAAAVIVIVATLSLQPRDPVHRVPSIQVSVVGPINAQSTPLVAVAQVSVGPSAEVADARFAYDDSISYRPARVVIAAGEDSGQDAGASGSSPYQ